MSTVENLEFTDRTVSVSDLIAANSGESAPEPAPVAPVVEAPVVEEAPVEEAPVAEEPVEEVAEEVAPTPEPTAESARIYSYDVVDPAGSDNAGDIRQVTTSFNEATNELAFKMTIDNNSEGFTLAINDGPNPKGHGDELALLYFDNSGPEPVISAYTYDGENNLNSFQNEPLVSSLGPDSPFSNISVTTDEYGQSMFSFELDATSIQEFSDSDKWTGVSFQDSIGVWLHPVDGLETSYDSNGFLETWNFDSQSYFDVANQAAESADAPIVEAPVEAPAPVEVEAEPVEEVANGFNADGFNAAGFDVNGFDVNGFNADGFDAHGFNADGVDVNGFIADGFNADGFNAAGFDAYGFDVNGFNADGFDANGFNADGFDANGFDANGLNAQGLDADGKPAIDVNDMQMITVSDAFNNGRGQEIMIDLSETLNSDQNLKYSLNFDESFKLDLRDAGFHGWEVKEFNAETGKLTLQVFSEQSENWHLDAAEVDSTFTATEFSRSEVKAGARGEAFTAFSFSAMDEFGNTVDSAFKLEVFDRSYASPVALDLNGDGEIGVTGETTIQDKSDISYIGETVEFDIDADGVLDQIEWFAGDGDGILVDTSLIGANGEIDGSALFGDLGGQYENGFVKLAQLDANADGNISGAETASLGIWVDNGDAIIQNGEIQTLDQNQIESISTQMEVDAEGRMRSTATTTDGAEIVTEDVWFAKGESGPTDQ